MQHQSHVVDNVLEMYDHLAVRIIKYCLSDASPLSLDVILDETSYPKQYADEFMRKGWRSLFQFIIAQHPNKLDIPEVYRKLFIYDHLLFAGAVFRISKMRPGFENTSVSLFSSGMQYALMIESNHGETCNYAGLSYYHTYTKALFDSYGLGCDIDSVPQLRRFAETVGDISNKSWILRDSDWESAITKNRETLVGFRAFLYAAAISGVTQDDYVENGLGVPRSTLLKDVDTFIALRDDEDTTPRDIRRFINRIEHYSSDLQDHDLIGPMLLGPFSAAKQAHDARFRPGQSQKQVPAPIPVYDLSILETFNPSYAIERVLQSDKDPISFSRHIAENHGDAIYSSLISQLYTRTGAVMPPAEDFSDIWTISLISDVIHSALIEERVVDTTDNDRNDIAVYIQSTQHLLLNFIDEQEIMGLSLVSSILRFQSDMNSQDLTDDEFERIRLLSQVWEDIAPFDREGLSESHRRLLDDVLIRAKLRVFFYTTVEAINVTNMVPFEKVIGCSRQAFFDYLEKLTFFLKSETTVETMQSFLADVPPLFGTVMLENQDKMQWVLPFNQDAF